MAGLKYSKDGQNWTLLKNYTIKNVDVLQTTGESTEGVMSQKAVSDALTAKADTSALSEYVKETEIIEKVTEVVKTETVKESSDLTDAIGDMVAKAIQDALKEGASQSDIKDAIDKAVADAIKEDSGDVKSAIDAAVADKATTSYVDGELAKKLDTATYNSEKANFATKDEVNAKADKATTIAGYNITDAKIEGGVITLGNETITPITSLDGVLKGTVKTVSVTGSDNTQTTSVAEGQQETVIFTNTSGSDATVTIPTTYKTPDGEAISLTIPNNGYGEVSYLNVGGTIYARAL